MTLLNITIANALHAATQQLAKTSDTPSLDAQILLSHITNQSKTTLLTYPEKTLESHIISQYQDLIAQRANGMPIAYLTGKRDFWDMTLMVTPDTLDPRPDTETLIQYLIDQLNPKAHLTIADIGTGTGAIGLALARTSPHWQIIATDISRAALATAQQNIAKYDKHQNIQLCQSNLTQVFPINSLDVLASNPPYLAEDDPHLQSLQHEPTLALTSPKAGLAHLFELIESGQDCLKPSGLICLEHGYDQADAIAEKLDSCQYTDLAQITDLAGHIRVSAARRSKLKP